MSNRAILDFRAQAEQMMDIVEDRLAANQRQMALDLMVLKFKALYEIGVASGRDYEKQGTYPFTAAFSPDEEP